jgi:hypothetical protein
VRGVRARHLLVATALLVALAGCGGDDEAQPPTVTIGDTGNVRLSASSWETYEAALAEAQKVNQAAITTFAKCRDLLTQNVASEQIEQCFGTTTSEVVQEGQEFQATLEGFESEVSGACAKALTDYAGLVKLYVASVNALSTGEESSPSQTQVDQASGALARTRNAERAFEDACKPAA